jgi:hypothetical protein
MNVSLLPVPEQPMRHTRHPLSRAVGTRNPVSSDASAHTDDASGDASDAPSPQVVTRMTLVTLSFPFSPIAQARTRTGRHAELRVTSVIGPSMRHTGNR